MVNGDLTRYPEVGCPWGARTGEPRAKAEARYCEPGWGPTYYSYCEYSRILIIDTTQT